MAEHLWMAANEVRNMTRLTPVHRKKVSSKKKMFGEKMFREKYSCSIIRTSNKNSWEQKVQRFYFLDETVHQ